MNNEKTAWIIGASSGIGEALAVKLAHSNYLVAISSRNKNKLDSIALKHNNLFACSLDLTKPDTIEIAKNQIVEKFGEIDDLFLNAVITHRCLW